MRVGKFGELMRESVKYKLMDKLDRALRNAEISITFEVMSLFTEKTYNEKLDYLAEEFNLSPKRIEGILHEMKN